MRTARIAMALTIALLITSATVAQEKKKRAGGVKLSPAAQAMLRMHTLHEALEGLDLTEEQKAAHQKLHEEIGPKMKEIMDKMKEILTQEQIAAVKEAGEKANQDGLTGRALFVTVEAALKLTDEQREKMAKPSEELLALQKQAAKKAMAILTPEERKAVQAKIAPQRKKKPGEAKKKIAE